MSEEKSYSYEEAKAEIARLEELESLSEHEEVLLRLLERWVLHFDQNHRLQ